MRYFVDGLERQQYCGLEALEHSEREDAPMTFP